MIGGIHIFRPSLLVGNRQEFRFGEQMAEKLSRIIPFLFLKELSKKYKPISAKDVAKGMYITALREESGIHTYNSNEITTIGINKTEKNDFSVLFIRMNFSWCSLILVRFLQFKAKFIGRYSWEVRIAK